MPTGTHICPADHAHATAETLTCYAHHRCRCTDCTDLASAYDSWRNHMNRTGRTMMVDATGTRRRLQALMVLGWSLPQIAARLNDRGPNIRRLLSKDRLTRRFAERIAAVYDELSMIRPAGHDRTSNAAIARTRIFAARRGWVPPLAWDDIDNDPEPATFDAAAEDAEPDFVAVGLAIAGHAVNLGPAERVECVRLLHEEHWSDVLIAERIRRDPKIVTRIRERLGLEAWEQHELITRKDIA